MLGKWAASMMAMNWNAVRLYRLSHRLALKGHKNLASVVSSFNRMITGVEIAPEAVIGKHFFIAHGNGIVIGSGARIGDHCTIYHQVTLGVGRDSSFHEGGAAEDRYPELGDYVIVYAGAKILGGVKVGDHCEIGANAVVTKDIPPRTVAVGIPAKVIKWKDEASLLPSASIQVN
jgi:serine O-acetyltransferase